MQKPSSRPDLFQPTVTSQISIGANFNNRNQTSQPHGTQDRIDIGEREIQNISIEENHPQFQNNNTDRDTSPLRTITTQRKNDFEERLFEAGNLCSFLLNERCSDQLRKMQKSHIDR